MKRSIFSAVLVLALAVGTGWADPGLVVTGGDFQIIANLDGEIQSEKSLQEIGDAVCNYLEKTHHVLTEYYDYGHFVEIWATRKEIRVNYLIYRVGAAEGLYRVKIALRRDEVVDGRPPVRSDFIDFANEYKIAMKAIR